MIMPPPGGPPPGMPPPPMMGPPPGAVPMPAPPPQPPGPPPGPDQQGPEPPSVLDIFMEKIATMLNDGQKKEAKALIASLPDEAIDLLRKMAAEDEVIDSLLGPLLPPEDHTVTYPVWYKPGNYPKPDHAAVIEAAEADAKSWEAARVRDAETLKYYVLESGSGYPDREAGDLPFVSTALRDETDAIIAKVSSATYTYELPYTSMSQVDATQEAEDFLGYCDCEADAVHEEKTGQDRTWAETWYGVVYGRIITLVVLDPESTTHPLCEILCDPTTTFPYWAGNHGLERVTRRYQSSASDVIGDFDYQGDVQSKMDKIVNKKSGKPYLPTDVGTVTQYWDRRWYVVLFDDVEILSAHHDYGVPPFAVTLSGVGMPMGMTDPNQSSIPTLASTPDPWLKYKATGHMEAQKRAHDQREAVGSVLYTIMSKADKPSWMIYQDDFARALGAPEIPNQPGDKMLLIKERELAQPMYLNADPSAFGPLMTMMGSDRQTNLSPPESLGISAGQNQSGNAMAQASDLGMNKLAAHLSMLERHKKGIAALRLMLWRDWGYLWQNMDGEYGQLTIPRAARSRRMQPGSPPAFTLEPKTLKKTGTRVRVHSSSVPLQALGPLGNAVTIWHNGQMMSRRTGMEIYGNVNPDAEFDEMQYEETLLDPDVAKLRRLEILQQRNPELADKYEKMITNGGGQQPPGPPGMGMVPNTSAMNLPALGLGPTGPTGRPPGMLPPPPQGMGMPPQPGPTLLGPDGQPIRPPGM